MISSKSQVIVPNERTRYFVSALRYCDCMDGVTYIDTCCIWMHKRHLDNALLFWICFFHSNEIWKKARAYRYHSLRFYTGSERPNWKTKEAIEPYYGLNFYIQFF